MAIKHKLPVRARVVEQHQVARSSARRCGVGVARPRHVVVTGDDDRVRHARRRQHREPKVELAKQQRPAQVRERQLVAPVRVALRRDNGARCPHALRNRRERRNLGRAPMVRVAGAPTIGAEAPRGSFALQKVVDRAARDLQRRQMPHAALVPVVEPEKVVLQSAQHRERQAVAADAALAHLERFDSRHRAVPPPVAQMQRESVLRQPPYRHLVGRERPHTRPNRRCRCPWCRRCPWFLRCNHDANP